MMTAGEIRRWLNQFGDDEPIAIDEGGMCLEARADEEEPDYIEIGGWPDDGPDYERDQEDDDDAKVHD